MRPEKRAGAVSQGKVPVSGREVCLHHLLVEDDISSVNASKMTPRFSSLKYQQTSVISQFLRVRNLGVTRLVVPAQGLSRGCSQDVIGAAVIWRPGRAGGFTSKIVHLALAAGWRAQCLIVWTFPMGVLVTWHNLTPPEQVDQEGARVRLQGLACPNTGRHTCRACDTLWDTQGNLSGVGRHPTPALPHHSSGRCKLAAPSWFRRMTMASVAWHHTASSEVGWMERMFSSCLNIHFVLSQVREMSIERWAGR